ncbi:MAG TPA: ZIP family metal transporter [Rhizomicrobium sp.]|jgi:ZIP family zinc transporter|nr:ZIP family metal transporter [Rhizomicrobium sp.]
MTQLLIIAIALAASAATMTGGLMTLKLAGKLPLVMGFSAGAVIGVAFFDLAPEALAAGAGIYQPRTLLAVAALGFFLYTMLDRLVARHDCEGQANPARGLMGAASFSAHSVLDGFAMGVAFQTSPQIGIVVAVAVLAHDFADGLNTVNVVMKHGGSRAFALKWLAMDAAAPVLGAGLSLLIVPSAQLLALLLALFCGFFLHIGASGLLPESHRVHPRASTTLATLLGAGFLYLVTELVR